MNHTNDELSHTWECDICHTTYDFTTDSKDVQLCPNCQDPDIIKHIPRVGQLHRLTNREVYRLQVLDTINKINLRIAYFKYYNPDCPNTIKILSDTIDKLNRVIG